MKNAEKSFAVQLGMVALILTMGVASMINGDNIRMHLDMFEWTHNMTALDPEVLEKFQQKEKDINNELFFGIVFIGGGMFWLLKMAWTYSKKPNDS